MMTIDSVQLSMNEFHPCNVINNKFHNKNSNINITDMSYPFQKNILVSIDNETIPGYETHYSPSIAFNSTSLYIAWSSFSGIGLSLSNDYGKSICNFTKVQGLGGEPKIVIGTDNKIHLVGVGDLKIFYGNSNNGQLFESPLQLTKVGRAENPHITLDDKNNIVYILYEYLNTSEHNATGLRMFRSDDNGQSFIDLGRIAITNQDSTLFVDKKGIVHIIYEVVKSYNTSTKIEYDDQLYYIKSEDKGVTFSNPIRITDTPETEYIRRHHPSMAYGLNGEIYVTWSDSRSGRWRTYFSRSIDGGKTFSKNIPVGLSQNTDDVCPLIDIDDYGTIHLVYSGIYPDQYNGNTIYVNSTNKGMFFNPEVQINDVNYTVLNFGGLDLKIDKETGRTFVAWTDMRDYSKYHNTEIYMSVGSTYFPKIKEISRQYILVERSWQYQVQVERSKNITKYGIVNGQTGLSISNSGSLSWIPAKNQVGNYTIQLFAHDVWGHNVSSSFNINVVTLPKITTNLISPNGNEEWIIGTRQNITWQATTGNKTIDGKLQAKLEYSITGKNGTYTLIAENLSNIGMYLWTIPNTPSNNAFVKITITDIYGQTTYDTSNKSFTIYQLEEPPTNMNNYYLCSMIGAGVFMAIGLCVIVIGVLEERKRKTK